MSPRRPRLAELKLQSLCAKAGALSHKTEEDERGWDVLVEFPFRPFDGPADMRPSPPVAYVQVKSTTTRRSLVQIKLSNALHAAQSSQPWFVVLFVSRPNERTRIYAVHFWDALIREALKEGRRAEVEKRQLNKARLTIRFSPEDERTDDLIRWMQGEIDRVKPEYAQVKSELSRSAGFEDSFGKAVMKIEAKNEDELTRAFLGLGEGLRVTSFAFTPSRFGIPSREPEIIKEESGIVHINPEPSGTAELRFRTSASAEMVVFKANVYCGPPGAPFEKQSFRFSAPCAEIVVNQADLSVSTAEINITGKHSLETFEKFSTLKAWFQDGPIELQIWTHAGRVTMGTLRSNGPRQSEWKDVAAAFKLLRSICSPADQEQIQIELKDLYSAAGLKTFVDISSAPTVWIEFEPAEGQPEKYTSLLYWFSTNLGNREAFALVERPVLRDIWIEDGKRRQVTAGAARFVDRFVLSGTQEENYAHFEQDFENRLARLIEAGGAPCGLGELRKFIGAGRSENS
jgi:hypothetical protein